MDGTKYVAQESSDPLRLDTVTNASTGCTYGITCINRDAFEYNRNLYDVVVAHDLTDLSLIKDTNDHNNQCAIGPFAFRGCKNLRSVSFECDLLAGIGYWSFASCTSLESVTFADGLVFPAKTADGRDTVGIDSYAFFMCKSLRTIRIPAIMCAARKPDRYETYGTVDSVFSSGYVSYWGNNTYCVSRSAIGPQAFYGCDSLESIVFEAGNSVGMFAYWNSGGCGLQLDTNLTTVIYEAKQPYLGDPDGSVGNGSEIQIWGDIWDSEEGETIPGAHPTFYYAVDYYYTKADAEADNSFADARLARVEYARDTSTAAINSGDMEALSEQMPNRALYAQKLADGVPLDPNEAARQAQSAGVAGFEDADEHTWLWMLGENSQSRRRGLTDSTYAYLVLADDLSTGRVGANEGKADNIEMLYRACIQNFSRGSIQNTMFDVDRYAYDNSGYSSTYMLKRGWLVGMSSSQTPWITLGAGGLLTLPEQLKVYDGTGRVLDIEDAEQFEVVYQSYDQETHSFTTLALTDSVADEPLLLTVRPLEGNKYGLDPDTCLQEWLLVYSRSGTVLERYSEDSSATWRRALYDNKYDNHSSEGFSTADGFGVCVSSNDATSALAAVSYAGLSKGPINVMSDSDEYGFELALASKNAYYSNGSIRDTSEALSFSSDGDTPSYFAADCYRWYNRYRVSNGLGSYAFSDTVALVNPSYLEDSAAAAATFAYNQGAPIFYTEYDGTLGDYTYSYLAGFKKVVIVGDETMVSSDVEAEVRDIVGNDATVDRVQGQAKELLGSVTAQGNACAISLAMADYLTSMEGASATWANVAIVVADGSNTVNDVVGAQNFAGHRKGVTLCVSTSADAKLAAQCLRDRSDKVSAVRIFGRSGAAANTSTFTMLTALGKTWSDQNKAVAALDTSDLIELYGVLFSADAEHNLTLRQRVWGTKAIAAGTYVGDATDGSAISYNLSTEVGALAQAIPLPSAADGLSYTGATQTGVMAGAGYTVVGGSSANAGEHVAIVSLKSGYKWKDGSVLPRTITWSIALVSLDGSVAALKSTSATYTGSAFVPSVSSLAMGESAISIPAAWEEAASDGTSSGDNYQFVYYRGTGEGAVTEANRVDAMVEPGTYTVVIEGLSPNCTGSTTATFEIKPILVDKPVAIEGLVYNGSVQVGVVCTDEKGRSLGYSAESAVATSAGTHTAIVTLDDGRAWTDGSTDPLELEWTIEPASLEGATVTLSADSAACTGKDVAPEVTAVELASKVSVAAEDYDVTYHVGDSAAGEVVTKIVDPGTYTVVVTGKGNCAGIATATFEARNVCVERPEVADGLVFNGREQVGLAGTDRYDVSDGKATDAGSYTATVTLKEGYCWEDYSTEALELTWVIERAELSDAIVTLKLDGNDVTAMEYNGQDLMPAAQATFGSGESVVTLVEGNDYTVTSYQGKDATGAKVSKMVEVGEYTVVLTGVGNFQGTMKAPYKVTPIFVAKPTAVPGLVYNGSAQIGVVETEGYRISGGSGTNAGAYTATATLAKGHRWNDGSEWGSDAKQNVDWSIVPASLTGAEVTLASMTRQFTGGALDFGVTSVVTAAAGEGAEADQGLEVPTAGYTVAYYKGAVAEENKVDANNLKDVGTYVAVVAGVGNFADSVQATFEITPIKIEKPVAARGLVYNGREQVGVPDGTGYTVLDGKETRAGVYGAVATLQNGYVWSDGSTDSVELPWAIAPASLEGALITLNAGVDQTHTGKSLDFGIRAVETSSGVAVGSGDYTTTYYKGSVAEENKIDASKLVDVGTYILVIKGTGSFTGSTQLAFTISYLRVEKPMAAQGLVYDGNQQVGVAANDNYTCDGVNAATDAGSYSVTVTLNEGCCWQDGSTDPLSIDWSIAHATLEGASVELSPSNPTYTGSALEPTVSGVKTTGGLEPGADNYKVTYYRGSADVENRVDKMIEADNYVVVLSGKGNYSGSVQVDFTIAPVSMTNSEVTLDSETHEYTGAAQVPTVMSVECTGDMRPAASDYDVAYYRGSVASANKVDEMVDAGTYIVVLMGKGNYAGTARVGYTITKTALGKATVTLGNPEVGYTGEAQVPQIATVALEHGGTALATDYEITYQRGTATVKADELVEVGTYTVVLTAKEGGSCTGQATATFKILPVGTPPKPVASAELVYSGSPQTPVKEDKRYSVATFVKGGTDEEPVWTRLSGNPTDVGVYKSTVTLSDGCVWSDGTKGVLDVEWSIVPASVKDYQIEIDPVGTTYNRKAQAPVVKSVKLGEGKDAKELERANYQVEYYRGSVAEANKVTEMVEAGNYVIAVSGVGNYTGMATVDWTIADISLAGAAVTLSQNECTYTGQSVAPSVEDVVAGGLTLSADEFEVSYYKDGAQIEAADIVSVGAYSVAISGKGSFTGTRVLDFQVNAHAVSKPQAARLTYNGTAQTGVTAGEGYNVAGTSTAKDAGTYQAIATLKSNYCWADGTSGAVELDWDIAPATLEGAQVKLVCGTRATYTGSVFNCSVTSVVTASVQGEPGLSVPASDYVFTCHKGSAEGEVVDAASVSDVGTYVVVVTGAGNFTGSAHATFVVTSVEVPKPSVTTTFTYDGTKHSVVAASDDYTVVGGTKTDVGNYTATVCLAAGRCWQQDGTADDLTFDWSIEAATLDGATVELSAKERTYTGGALDFGVSSVVTADGVSAPVSASSGYTAVYHRESAEGQTVDAASLVDVGTYVVVVNGAGNFKGSTQVSFAILPIKVGKPQTATSVAYDGTSHAVVPASVDGDYTVTTYLRRETDGQVTWVETADCTNAGIYKSVVALTTGRAWADGTTDDVEVVWTIEAASIEGATVELSATRSTYTGSTQKPTVTVKLDGTTLPSSAYSVTYYTDEAATTEAKSVRADGAYTIVIAGRGNYQGSVRATYTIDPQYISTPVATTGLVYTGSSQTGMSEGTGYKLSKEGTSSAKNAGEYEAIVTLKEGYCWRDTKTKEDRTVSWSIAAQSLTGATVTLAATSTTATGSHVNPTVTSVQTADGTKVTSANYDIAYYKGSVAAANKVDSIVDAGTYVVQVTFKGNYSGAATATYTVNPAQSPDSGSSSSQEQGGGSSPSQGPLNPGGNAEDEFYIDEEDSVVTKPSGGPNSISGTGSSSSSLNSDDDDDAEGVASSSSTGTVRKGFADVYQDANGWVVFPGPGKTDAGEVIVVENTSESPLPIVLVALCLAALAGAVFFASRSQKETDDQIGAPRDAA